MHRRRSSLAPGVSAEIRFNKYRFDGGKALSRLAQNLVDLGDAPARMPRAQSPPRVFNGSPKLESKQPLNQIIRKVRAMSRKWSNRVKLKATPN